MNVVDLVACPNSTQGCGAARGEPCHVRDRRPTQRTRYARSGFIHGARRERHTQLVAVARDTNLVLELLADHPELWTS